MTPPTKSKTKSLRWAARFDGQYVLLTLKNKPEVFGVARAASHHGYGVLDIVLTDKELSKLNGVRGPAAKGKSIRSRLFWHNRTEWKLILAPLSYVVIRRIQGDLPDADSTWKYIPS